ncbi:hypothetical protein CUJ83_08715 [Methanocella sp. CWC-04]|uniref:Uncharacterized protein n=1 Tax=Methanooceanicella nereidis TaxID=2052831 RepID=A0AAP2W679_9EURY|nr:hypothetical protein [Methanocella sp. CWC-04]MCD1295078.1 hypothetical protein [Methanocella sp. CWC-04]
MFRLVYNGHSIEVIIHPEQQVFYDGREVSRKNRMLRTSHHEFNVTENGKDARYSVIIKSFIGGTTFCGIGGGYKVIRDGEAIFNCDATTFSMIYNGHRIEALDSMPLPVWFKTIRIDGEKVIRKLQKPIGTMTFDIFVPENSNEVNYEIRITHKAGITMAHYTLHKNGKLILTSDTGFEPPEIIY